MDINIKEENGGFVAMFDGRLDTPAAVKAQQDMTPLMENADKEITLDCEKLEYISSSGLRILLNIYKHTRKNSRRAIIRHASDYVEEVLRTGGFLQLYEIE